MDNGSCWICPRGSQKLLDYGGRFRLWKSLIIHLKWVWFRAGQFKVRTRCSILFSNWYGCPKMGDKLRKDWHNNQDVVIVIHCCTSQRDRFRCSSACHGPCWLNVFLKKTSNHHCFSAESYLCKGRLSQQSMSPKLTLVCCWFSAWALYSSGIIDCHHIYLLLDFGLNRAATADVSDF